MGSEKTFGRILGIDVNPDVIHIANNLNNKVFRKQNIEFLARDAIGLNIEEQFDVVFCASTFHYFGDKQESFLQSVHKNLKNNGIAIIEIETYPQNSHPQKGRGRRKLAYPNRKWIEDKTKTLFDIISVDNSVRQGGADFPRLFYRFKKKST